MQPLVIDLGLIITLLVLTVLIGAPIAMLRAMKHARRHRPSPVDLQVQEAIRDAGANAQRLDAIFAGQEPVVYDVRPLDAISAPTVIAGGIERGYKLLSEEDGILTFTART